MPPGLQCEVLYHNTREHDKLRIDLVQDCVVREVETVCNLDR